ncbi:MAG: hypothetical protein KC468_38305 [Myxococcales bacterium]|nr:hypothetical protein [Myxococcales bacterium]
MLHHAQRRGSFGVFAALSLALLAAPAVATAAPSDVDGARAAPVETPAPAPAPEQPAPEQPAPPEVIDGGATLEGPRDPAEHDVPMTRIVSGPALPRRGVGMLASGAALTGLGVAGRVALEVFWGAVVGLKPGDPFQRTSTGNIILLTNMNNVLVASGLGLMSGGLHRRGFYDGRVHRPRSLAADDAGLAHDERARYEKLRRDGIIVLTLGAALWGSTRGIFLSVVNACETNACVYGYLESTYWVTATMIHAGAGMLAYSSGRLRASHGRRARWALAPMLGPARGLSVAGSF